jgi:hypothetical protein
MAIEAKAHSFPIIPESRSGRAIAGLGIAATSIALWAARRLGEQSADIKSTENSHPQNDENLEYAASGDGGFIPSHDGAEIVLISQQKVVFDLNSLRSEGII